MSKSKCGCTGGGCDCELSVTCEKCGWHGKIRNLKKTRYENLCPKCGHDTFDDGQESESDTAPPPLSGKAFSGLTKERCLRLAELEGDHTVGAGTLPAEPTGIEAMVCADIAARQRMGIKKYGRTVAESTDDWIRHFYEEMLDGAIYAKAEMERRAKDA